jgi:hypothetical protein
MLPAKTVLENVLLEDNQIDSCKRGIQVSDQPGQKVTISRNHFTRILHNGVNVIECFVQQQHV